MKRYIKNLNEYIQKKKKKRLKSYFCTGGRHQMTIDGEIVNIFNLHRCCVIKLCWLWRSKDNLNDYSLIEVPVNIEYSKSDPNSGNKIVSAMSVYDNEFEDGITDGPCPFMVHGLTGPEQILICKWTLVK